jgi:hypothetical protein
MTQQYYWNQENFEGLATLSAALREDSRLAALARYCDLREKGLRRQAFAELEAFLGMAGSWDALVQREAVSRILDLHWKTPQAHQFLADPLRTRFVEPVLNEWRAAEPMNSVPARHLALLRGDIELLREALRMNRRDDVLRTALAGILISFVDHATHHLVEGKFIGDEADAMAALAEAAAVLKDVSDPSSVRGLSEDVQDLSALLADWREYRKAPEASFPEWCRKRGRKHPWWNIVYYDGGAAYHASQ